MALSVDKTLTAMDRVFDGCKPSSLKKLHMVEKPDVKISEDGRSMDLTVHLTEGCTAEKQAFIAAQIFRHLAGDFGILGKNPEVRAEKLEQTGRLKIHFIPDYDLERLERAEIPQEEKDIFAQLVDGRMQPAPLVRFA